MIRIPQFLLRRDAVSGDFEECKLGKQEKNLLISGAGYSRMGRAGGADGSGKKVNRRTECFSGNWGKDNRESGENPERSGHCNRGVSFRYPIVQQYEKGKRSDNAEVRKPALYGEVKLPCKV